MLSTKGFIVLFVLTSLVTISLGQGFGEYTDFVVLIEDIMLSDPHAREREPSSHLVL